VVELVWLVGSGVVDGGVGVVATTVEGDLFGIVGIPLCQGSRGHPGRRGPFHPTRTSRCHGVTGKATSTQPVTVPGTGPNTASTRGRSTDPGVGPVAGPGTAAGAVAGTVGGSGFGSGSRLERAEVTWGSRPPVGLLEVVVLQRVGCREPWGKCDAGATTAGR